MGKKGRVFIDTNIINVAVIYKRENIIEWINNLYEEIYIHSSVLNELLINRFYAEQQIQHGNWILFNPDDENCLSDEEYIIYESYKENVQDGFYRLIEKKKRQGREIKITSNIGEIDSLAAALFLSAKIICSNDYEIREVIANDGFYTAASEEDIPQLITQDTIEDFCVYCVEYGIATKKAVRKLFKVVYSGDYPDDRQKKLNALNDRLNELND